MKKNSTYIISGDIYEFNNDNLKTIIKTKNPNHGALEAFYREVVNLDVGISYDTVKSWVNKKTNPTEEGVNIIAEVLGVPYKSLLTCTHVAKEKSQRILFTDVLDTFALKYRGLSNIFDMIIGVGYNKITGEAIVSDFAERIINLVMLGGDEVRSFPEMLGYEFKYSDDELQLMSISELKEAAKFGYVDHEGNSFCDENYNITIDRKKFVKSLLEKVSWLDDEDYTQLEEAILEAENWWDYCEMPYALLKVDIKVCGRILKSFTYGPGWSKPSHDDKWKLTLDMLNLLGTNIEKAGLCGMHEIHINQFESEVFLTIELL